MPSTSPFGSYESRGSGELISQDMYAVAEKRALPENEASAKRAKISTTENTSAVEIAEYPAVTKHEYDLIAPYLKKFEFEDLDDVDDVYYLGTGDGDSDEEADRRPNVHQRLKNFLKQVRESRGYDVTICPHGFMNSPFVPLWLDHKLYKASTTKVTNFAIDHINVEARTKFGKYYQLLDLQKAVQTMGLTLLLTFTAWEFDVGADANADANTPVRTFQAMVHAPPHEEHEFLEWRFRPGSLAPKALAA